MIRQAYCSLDALEEIYAFPDEYAALHQILELHHAIALQLSEDEFDVASRRSECLKVLIKRASSKPGYALDNTPHTVQELLANEAGLHAGALFVVDEPAAVCEELSQSYGICVLSLQAQQQAGYLTKRLLRREISQNISYQTGDGIHRRTGWFSAVNPPVVSLQAVPLNSLIVIDNYLLGDNGDKLARGQANLISLLHALLPEQLQLDFELLLVTLNTNAFLKSKNLRRLTEALQAELPRSYTIKIGVLTLDDASVFHRRALIGNYYFGESHHGFSCFDEEHPKWANHLTIEGAFANIAEEGCDVPWVSMHNELYNVRQLRNDNHKRNTQSSFTDPNCLAFGHCDNRLLTLVR